MTNGETNAIFFSGASAEASRTSADSSRAFVSVLPSLLRRAAFLEYYNIVALHLEVAARGADNQIKGEEKQAVLGGTVASWMGIKL